MNTKVQLSDMELHQVTGGGIREIYNKAVALYEKIADFLDILGIRKMKRIITNPLNPPFKPNKPLIDFK